jgi:5S rRNA maturation endonuclease (ribonuclease M5)
MPDTAKYLIHARISADGVVERNDVVGAVFGQTEGLLGDELDLRDLQDSSKVGRIDVEIDSEGGQSFGHLTIATSLDKVETAVLAAGLETIDRVGPCRADLEVTSIEDVRAAKRREVVDRATELLTDAFEGSMMSSKELVEEVRESVRVEDIAEYEGYPAGPHVGGSDAVIVVEGRADVAQLLGYGIKNALAVEGTNVPDAVAELTRHKTVTAFLDGDRGGDLILKELVQVGEVDYVAFAPEDRSVEDLSRHEVMAALRDKVPYETLTERTDDGDEEPAPAHELAATDGSTRPAPEPAESAASATPEGAVPADAEPPGPAAGADTDTETDDAGTGRSESSSESRPAVRSVDEDGGEGASTDEGGPPETDTEDEPATPETLRGHVRDATDTGEYRLLDVEMGILATGDAGDAFDAVREADRVPTAVVLDGELSQRVLDVCAQRSVDQVVAASLGEFVKQPTGVRVRAAADLLEVPDQ